MSNWDSLSMAQRADVMKLAIENGIYDLDTIRGAYNEFAKGGSIHIKPENRGKFTALKKRTGHSATWFKQHGTPAQKKMATFALNARKWKHGYGGNLYGDGSWLTGYEGYNPQATKTTSTYAPNAKYGMNGKPYEQWASDTRAAAAAQEWANKQPQLKPMTMSNEERALAKKKGDADALYAQKQDLQQKGVDALMTLGTFARPSTWAALPFRGIEHFGEGFGTEWINTPLDLALPLAWQGAVNTSNTAANAWRYRGFNAGNTPRGLLSAAKPLIARGTPEITAENAASIIPEQWTAAQDAAIARGNMAEAQRLRDLHFKVSAPNTTIVDELGAPIHNYHGTTNTFTAFDPQKIGSTTGDMSGFFFSDNKAAADFYSHETGSFWNNLKLMFGLYKGHKPQIYNVYLNTTKPMITDFHGGVDKVGREMLVKEAIKNRNDANILQNIIDGPPALPHNVTIMRNPKHIKSADAVTYDDNGIRIPLGERDNFKLNDIRYSWLSPFIGLGTLGTLYGAPTDKTSYR